MGGTVVESVRVPVAPTMLSSADDPLVVMPASAVWRGPDPSHAQDQLAFYQREGFLILRGALTPREVSELHAELGRLSREYKTLPKAGEGFDLEPNQDSRREGPTFRKIGGISVHSAAFLRLMCQPRIVAAVSMIFGGAVELYRDVCMMKAARVGRQKPWHQDSGYWSFRPMSLCSAFTALDDASPENGCLQIVPRSHSALLPHHGKEAQVTLNEELQRRTVYVPLAAGDTLLFHSLTLHASEPNRSDQDRRVCVMSYKSPAHKPGGAGPIPAYRAVTAAGAA